MTDKDFRARAATRTAMQNALAGISGEIDEQPLSTERPKVAREINVFTMDKTQAPGFLDFRPSNTALTAIQAAALAEEVELEGEQGDPKDSSALLPAGTSKLQEQMVDDYRVSLTKIASVGRVNTQLKARRLGTQTSSEVPPATLTGSEMPPVEITTRTSGSQE